MDEKLPIIDLKVIEFIEGVFPDKSPELDMTDREIWMARGAVSVSRKLRDIYNQQNENMMIGD